MGVNGRSQGAQAVVGVGNVAGSPQRCPCLARHGGLCGIGDGNGIDDIDDEQGRTIINSRPQESIVVTHLADIQFHDPLLLLSATT